MPSAFHLSKLDPILHSSTRVVLNGLNDNSVFSEDDTDTTLRSCRSIDTFIYASAPNRGLEHVLRSWTTIRSQAPSARLRVFYGFTSSKDAQLRHMMGLGEESFLAWKHSIELLLEQDGVEYVGEVCCYEIAFLYIRFSSI